MRLRHFESLRPVCPVCRSSIESGSPLSIARVARELEGHILEAVIHCSNPECQREYPVIDGIPLIIPHIRRYIAEAPLWILARQDLTEVMEGIVGDCLGPGSDFDLLRQQVSTYAWEHYGDLDPAETAVEPRPGGMVAALRAGLELAGTVPTGPVLDIGCGVGRGSFVVADRTDELVLGIDLHFPMLQVAGRVLRDGIVRYPRRRVGIVYDRREFPARFESRDNVDFWCCDAAALPFAPGSFSLALAMNVLDSTHAPRQFLESVAGGLRQDGKAVLTSPYDWSTGATPVEGWLGGHSQRSPSAGASEPVLRSLLTPGEPWAVAPALRIVAERDDLTWRLRLHDRGTMTYRMHLLVAERSGGTGA